MRAELLNYLRLCANPRFMWGALAAAISRAALSLAVRTGTAKSSVFQPTEIRRLRKAVLSTASRSVGDGRQPVGALGATASLQLSVGTHTISGDSDWSVNFADGEETASLHRWNWLLRTGSDGSSAMRREDGLSLMRSWIAWSLGSPNTRGDAYTSGERIVNGTLFLALTGDDELPPDIAAAFRTMGQDVARHLEYYPSGLTGNHAFNNGRALFFAGVASGLPGARDLAFAVASERLPRLVTPDGFLREGSSHYHFLFTRWVLEMLWLADRTADKAFADLLSPYAELLVRRCWFLLVYDEVTNDWQIPLVGDISPDCPPDWLVGLPWSTLACRVHRPAFLPTPPSVGGWAQLFGQDHGKAKGMSNGTELFPLSGWLKIVHCPWTVFARAESTDGCLVAGHGHSDLMSFVLYHKGQPLIIDPGRSDYTGSEVSSYGVSVRAHNTMLLNGCAPTSELQWASSSYRAVQVACAVDCHLDQTIVTIQHDGFMRFSSDQVTHTRELRLTSSRFDVIDQVGGGGIHDVSLRFHFAPKLRFEDSGGGRWEDAAAGVVFQSDARLVGTSQMGSTKDPIGGVYSSKYGVHKACQTLDLTGSFRCPVSLSNSLSVEFG